MNEENDLDQITNADVMLGPIQRIALVGMINAVKMKLEKAVDPMK